MCILDMCVTFDPYDFKVRQSASNSWMAMNKLVSKIPVSRMLCNIYSGLEHDFISIFLFHFPFPLSISVPFSAFPYDHLAKQAQKYAIALLFLFIF